MALDGAFLHFLKNELNSSLKGARVDKIHQPNSEEFIFLLRNRNGTHRVLFSARANSPRVHITKHALENPETPPMLCMLFRKKLIGAKLISVEQSGLERALSFNFDARNELGDIARVVLVVEVMGKYSNVILVDENSLVIDALKRVDASMSSKREVLPRRPYLLPPKQEKLSPLTCGANEILERILNFGKDKMLASAILAVVQGVSPIVCKELSFNATGKIDAKVGDLASGAKLAESLEHLKEQIINGAGEPCAVKGEGAPIDFSFREISCCGAQKIKKYSTFSSLLDEFYFEKDTAERMKSKAQSLSKMLANISSRLERKIEAQRAEIIECSEKESYKVLGDLINSNLHKIKKGMNHVRLENFYSDDMSPIDVELDPLLTGAQNAQKYYKEYRKAKTAQAVLESEIKKAADERTYIDAVADAISRAQTEQELGEIRQELAKEGYLKEKKKRHEKKCEFAPLEFESSEGTRILVGKNNRQNDRLTLKIAEKNYVWLHVKELPGSHVIIMQNSNDVGEKTLIEAAQLAAFHSKAKNSSGVAVDYTQVRNVKKPSGAKPGMVIYVENKTLYVTPDAEIRNKLAAKTNGL